MHHRPCLQHFQAVQHSLSRQIAADDDDVALAVFDSPAGKAGGLVDDVLDAMD